MHYRESFQRNKVLGTAARFMPALKYNQMRLLFQRCGKSCLFIPIRNLQYLAVIDHEEIIFVDSQRRAYVEFSWQKFIPQSRTSLDDPVAYQFVYYETRALQTMQRAEHEFALATQQMSSKQHAQASYQQQGNSVIPFNKNRS